ncbi:MAG: DUF3365 domain-containing protein [Planctomycetales bacterium]|nr:DUF3365 domain-containing protein [Planctomycetales bacterium]
MMRRVLIAMACVCAIGLTNVVVDGQDSAKSDAEVERGRATVKMLDNIFKQAIVLITDKYVHDEDDFPAGSAAVVWFKAISEAGPNSVRLIDASGDPYKATNVAQDEFEKAGIKELKAGKPYYDEVAVRDGKRVLRAVTAVPVVMDKCVMCHPHYKNVKPGEAIGAISYTVPL